jgi:hypothetical protein
MSDWDQLHEIGHRVSSPPFDSLVASAARRDRRSRIVTGAVTLALLAALGFGIGMVNDEESVLQPAQDPSDSVSTPGQVALPAGVLALPESDGVEDAVVLEAGRYRVPLSDTLSFDVDVPPGTEANNGGLYLAVEETVLKVEAAGQDYGVPSDPCSAYTRIEPAGPTVGNLVGAIRNQPIYRASRPEPIEFAGAVGQYVELRIPRAYDASSCGDGQVGLPGNPGSNNNMSPGYVGHWWIVEVEGQRAVVQTLCDQCDPEPSEPIARMVQSITFTPTPA